jgi:hypothetical protein
VISASLSRRLVKLEAIGAAEAADAARRRVLSPEEREALARAYEASLDEPMEDEERARACWTTCSARQMAADYETMLRGGPAPWEA